jgi:hypothetical protein
LNLIKKLDRVNLQLIISFFLTNFRIIYIQESILTQNLRASCDGTVAAILALRNQGKLASDASIVNALAYLRAQQMPMEDFQAGEQATQIQTVWLSVLSEALVKIHQHGEIILSLI